MIRPMHDQTIVIITRLLIETDHTYSSDQDQRCEISSAVQVYLVEKRSLKYLNKGVEDYVRQLKRQKQHPT